MHFKNNRAQDKRKSAAHRHGWFFFNISSWKHTSCPFIGSLTKMVLIRVHNVHFCFVVKEIISKLFSKPHYICCLTWWQFWDNIQLFWSFSRIMIRQWKEMDGLCISPAVPKIQWDSNLHCPYGYKAMGNLYLYLQNIIITYCRQILHYWDI